MNTPLLHTCLKELPFYLKEERHQIYPKKQPILWGWNSQDFQMYVEISDSKLILI